MSHFFVVNCKKERFLEVYLMKGKKIKDNTKTPETGFDHPRLPCVCFSISAVILSTLSSCHSLCAPAQIVTIVHFHL